MLANLINRESIKFDMIKKTSFLLENFRMELPRLYKININKIFLKNFLSKMSFCNCYLPLKYFPDNLKPYQNFNGK